MKLNTNRKKSLAFSTLFVALIFGYQNCSGRFEAKNYQQNPSLSPSNNSSPLSISEALDKIDPVLIDQATTVMQTHCNSCHGPQSEAFAGIDFIDNWDAVFAAGLIVPGDRKASRIAQRMIAGTMPPSGGLAQDQVDIILALVDASGVAFARAENAEPVPPPITSPPTTETPASTPPTAPPPTPPPSTPPFQAEAMAILQTHCRSCHGAVGSLGGVGDILDVDNLVAKGKIFRGNGAASRIYLRMTNPAAPMPPSGLLPSSEAATIRAWIDGL